MGFGDGFTRDSSIPQKFHFMLLDRLISKKPVTMTSQLSLKCILSVVPCNMIALCFLCIDSHLE